MVGDPVADFITQIKNASAVGKSDISLPHSKLKEAIAGVLKNKGYIGDFSVKNGGAKSRLIVELKYDNGTPAVEGVRRLSKPSRRLYTSSRDLRPVKSGRGMAVVSTPRGVLDSNSAKEAKVGGEILFEIW